MTRTARTYGVSPQNYPHYPPRGRLLGSHAVLVGAVYPWTTGIAISLSRVTGEL